MPVKIVRGNIFTTNCQVIVNTINCVGVMGAGIALECRLRYPEMHEKYIDLCEEKKISVGMLWLYKSKNKWILNFPTKKHWRYPSKKEYLHLGLKKFSETYKLKEIQSVAFPMLGTDRGGIDALESQEIMISYLDHLDIDIEIYQYDKTAEDDLYDQTKKWLLSNNTELISKQTGISKNLLSKVINAVHNPKVTQLNQLAHEKGIGIKTLEKLFLAIQQEKNQGQVEMFDIKY
jgi:O-acetyl-ADP-ribose deacetylase (regulator of RNase III)